jgi:glycosyltransferase involved in cell wall biosynthesis
MSYSSIALEPSFAVHPAVRPAPSLSVVVPCHNEEAALPHLFRRVDTLNASLLAQGLMSRPMQLVLVDDGSCDATWQTIAEAATTLPVTGVRLARNHGHQHALFAGLMQARSEAVVSMDADLQDDPEAIGRMLEAYMRGAEVVYGVRDRRDTDTWFKRHSARAYYATLERLGVDLIPDHADFRLMSRKALKALSKFGETNLFLRGLVRQLGFRSEIVLYDRAARVEGESKYTLGKMVALGLEGITSFSVKPLRMIVVMGFWVAALAFLFGLFSVWAWIGGHTLPGWTSIVLPLSLLGGMHLIALGVIGEYVGKIYQETKHRPRFLIDEVVNPDLRDTVNPALTIVTRRQ